uniref:Reverse transcriptase domain-containing protein n=1 Tax=Rhodnius prolixus TaxID=13249 RepID=T1HBE3_RHOPR
MVHKLRIHFYFTVTSNIPTDPNTTLLTYADDTALLSTDHDPVLAHRNLQSHLSSLEQWFQKWAIKLNEIKSQNITFTLRRITLPPVFYNLTPLPVVNVAWLPWALLRPEDFHGHVIDNRK